MRLFIAIEISAELKNALTRLTIDIPGARWVPAEQIHLTLAFLGEVAETTLELLTAELARIQAPGFALRFAGTGCFPNQHRPRVLWIGLEPEPRLQQLAAAIHAAVLSCGIPQEERPFSPHITLARLKVPTIRAFDPVLKQQSMEERASFDVGEFTLYQSRLTQHGAVHIPVKHFPLTGTRGRVEPP